MCGGEGESLQGSGSFLRFTRDDLATCARELASHQLPEDRRSGDGRGEGLIFYALGGPFMRSTTGAPSVSNRIREAGYIYMR